MQTSRIEADVSIYDRRRGAAPPHVTRRVSRGRTRRIGQARRYGYTKGPARFVAGVAVIVALATAAFGVEAYVRAGHEQKRITALQADLAGLKQRIATDEDGAASVQQNVRKVAAQARSAHRDVAHFNWALQSVPSEAQLAGVRNEFAAYAACIPELQSEIAGLGVSWRVNPSKSSIDFFKLFTRAPISGSCARTLSGR
jgi:cell division protein FtsB